jgi:addiction module HigA family antidote
MLAKEDIVMAKRLPPLHPGEVLREEFLKPLGMSPGALAKATGVPRTRIERIAAETTGVTADTALRLGKALNTSAELWMNLQRKFDLEMARLAIAKDLKKIAPVVRDAHEETAV